MEATSPKRRFVFTNSGLEEGLQHIPSTAAELCQKLSARGEEAAEDLRNTQHEVVMRDGAEHVRAKPLAEFHDPFLMAGGGKK